MKKSHIYNGMIIYTIVQIIIILIHLFTDGWLPPLNYSISRYVGSTWWSALIFLFSNLYIFYHELQYYREVNHTWHLSKFWRFLSFYIPIALVGLSLCPLGLFDANIEQPGLVSLGHEICSRSMFLAMLIMSAVTAYRFRKASRLTFFSGLAFFIYGVFCFAAYIGNLGWYLDTFYIWESLYLYGFFAFLLTIPATSAKPTSSSD